METPRPQAVDPDPVLLVGCTKRTKRGIEEYSVVSVRRPKMEKDTPAPPKKSKKSVAVIVEQEPNTTAKSVLHGILSVIGRRRVMEDAVMAALGVSGHDFFAVYDGHGDAEVANACRDRMLDLVAEELEEVRRKGLVIEWQRSMRECFKKMDDEVDRGEVEVEGGVFTVKTVGSSAVVVMVGKEEVVVANCGDSRAVLCRGGLAVPLSRDHKVIDDDVSCLGSGLIMPRGFYDEIFVPQFILPVLMCRFFFFFLPNPCWASVRSVYILFRAWEFN